MLLTSDSCEICGDLHHPSYHGEAIIVVDHGRDSIKGGTLQLLNEATALLGVSEAREPLFPVIEELNSMDDDHEELLEACNDAEATVSNILQEAGYHLDNNADSGAWLIYGPVDPDCDNDIALVEFSTVVFDALVQNPPDEGISIETAGWLLVKALERRGFVIDFKREESLFF